MLSIDKLDIYRSLILFITIFSPFYCCCCLLHQTDLGLDRGEREKTLGNEHRCCRGARNANAKESVHVQKCVQV